MKKLILLPYSVLLLVFFLGSCSIDKRLYRDGYHVEWNHKKAEATKNNPSVSPADQLAEAEVEEQICLTESKKVIEKQSDIISSENESVEPQQKKKMFSGIKQDDRVEESKLSTTGKATSFSEGFKKGFTTLMPIQDGKIHPLAIASFVIGIISLFSYYGAFVLGILAIVFGAIALKKIRNEGYRGSTLAWVGLICGIVSIALTLAIISVY